MRDDSDMNLSVPSITRIDYTHPERHIGLTPSLGNAERIRALAREIGGEGVAAIVAVAVWIDRHLAYDPRVAYAWRNCDAILDTTTYGSCADHAMLFGALLRAGGIPTVWVKTMDEDWIREFRATGSCETWRGHVYLEVFVNERWRLLDAQRMTLWDNYSPDAHSLPDCRYAYDKGDDPCAMVLSLDWERWKRQTTNYFTTFDLTRMTQDAGSQRWFPAGRHLLDVYIAADAPVYGWITKRCEASGYRVQKAFNTDFEEALPMTQGSILIVTFVGDRLVLPEAYHMTYLPVSFAELRVLLRVEERGQARRTLADGTQVIVVYAKGLDAMQEEIHALAF